MWLSFWRSRNRFSLEELRYLTDQLQKVQIVNELNKDVVVEVLRSIAELMTYGDQHDSSFFEFFMEKQVMAELVRVLKISRTISVSLQLLQTMSIMIQNLKNEHAIYYLFSNEHMNYLITYSFDFRNEELLSHYISFLRAISGKLDKDTISLLVKTKNDEVDSFPLYVEAIKFAFHEESMIRIAVRTLTLNVYHVGDDGVNRYVTRGPLANYFKDFVTFLEKQCSSLNTLVFQASKDTSGEFSSGIIAAIDEIEDNLYYISDVVSAGIPDVGRLIEDNLLQLLILPLLLPSLTIEAVNEKHMGAITAMYILCCILRIVKIKDLANTIVAALFLPREAFIPNCEAIINGDALCSKLRHLFNEANYDQHVILDSEKLKVDLPDGASLSSSHVSSNLALREVLLSYLTGGNYAQVLGSLNVLATLSQTKELDETMLDAFGILPQRKQQKKLLLQALVGESAGEEQLFYSEPKQGCGSELDYYLQKLKEQFRIPLSYLDSRSSPHLHKFQVLDALVNLLCRDISPEALWNGGWLLRQLLPSGEAEFNRRHLKLLRESFVNCSQGIQRETKGVWADQLITVISDEWRKCKKATEVSTPWKELKYVLLPSEKSQVSDLIPTESSFSAGEKMCDLVKEFVLFYQLLMFFHGRVLSDHAPICPPIDEPETSRAKAVGLEYVGPKPGSELKLVDAVPCRIAFERGKERHFNFQALSVGISGWIVLVEELPLKQNFGVVRVIAPLAGCNPRVDDKHPRWLHLRIRPSTLPSTEAMKSAAASRAKSKLLVDGRWTLAFRDEESCQSALGMIHEELSRQSQEVERRLKTLFDVDSSADYVNLRSCPDAAAQ